MFGKTKFPGKPSKLVHKKRVSVLSCDNNFDSRDDDHCEIDDGKNLASENNNHGFQVCLIYAKKSCAFYAFSLDSRLACVDCRSQFARHPRAAPGWCIVAVQSVRFPADI